MKSYSLLVGSNNRRGYFARGDERQLREITARHFPTGFTILNAKGSWYDATSRTYRNEEAREVVICTGNTATARVHAWCRELGRALRQKELLLIEVGRVRRFKIAASVLDRCYSEKTRTRYLL
jgi:hypothetical protein